MGGGAGLSVRPSLTIMIVTFSLFFKTQNMIAHFANLPANFNGQYSKLWRQVDAQYVSVSPWCSDRRLYSPGLAGL